MKRRSFISSVLACLGLAPCLKEKPKAEFKVVLLETPARGHLQPNDFNDKYLFVARHHYRIK